MSPVKLIHVLKRLEILDRDIQELRDLEENMNSKRSYSDSLKISLELQINGLLNERVKLMELRIENPPEHLIPGQKEIEDPSLKLNENRSKFTLDDFEKDYLDVITNGKNKTKQIKPILSQDEVDKIIEDKTTKINREVKSKAERLKEIPKLDY